VISKAIISLAALLLPCASIAQAEAGTASSKAFVDRHVTFMVARCPEETSAYGQLAVGGLATLLAEFSDADQRLNGVILDRASDVITDTDAHFGSLSILYAKAVADSLKFMGLYRAEIDVADDQFAQEYDRRKALADTSLALTKCLWPSSQERDAFADSFWASSIEYIADATCDLHFATLVQRYLDTPITQMTPAERQATGDRLMSEHDAYREASSDTLQCGEFL
jgi:hypothetical protein